MFRLFFYLIALIVLISVIRTVAGVLLKGIGVWFASTSPTHPHAPSTPAGGELKKDPVCGTFVSTATSVKKTVGLSVLHFCSVECRDKFQG